MGAESTPLAQSFLLRGLRRACCCFLQGDRGGNPPGSPDSLPPSKPSLPFKSGFGPPQASKGQELGNEGFQERGKVGSK